MTNEVSMRVLLDDINKVKRFVNIALSLPFDVDMVSGRYKIDGKSIMGILSLDISKPVEIKFDTDYEDRARFAFTEFEVKE